MFSAQLLCAISSNVDLEIYAGAPLSLNLSSSAIIKVGFVDMHHVHAADL
jgi:hypothetical protein